MFKKKQYLKNVFPHKLIFIHLNYITLNLNNLKNFKRIDEKSMLYKHAEVV